MNVKALMVHPYMVEWLGEWGTWGSSIEWENLLAERFSEDWVDPMEYLALYDTVNH
jgi:hypothetical protein